jgi:hypothetical protein
MGKGANASQTNLANQQTNFATTLQNDFGTAFAGQQNILQGLTKSMNNTLAAGPSQFGFSAPETSALNTTATSGISQSYQNQRAAAGEAAAAAGGGGAVLPTGSQGQTQAELASQAAQSTSNALLGIQEAGYKQGSANYDKAVSGLSTVASLENPSGLASNADSASNSAFNMQTQVKKENDAANPWGQIGGLAGSLAGAFLGGPGGAALGGSLGGMLGGGGSSASDAMIPGTSNMESSLSAPQITPGAGIPQAPTNFGPDPTAWDL